MVSDPRELYLSGYVAFDQGDFGEATSLATECLAIAPPDSYWHFGALGLRCWAANYMEDNLSVERDACDLLAEEAGLDKPWFDGLALLNLGLVRWRAGHINEAKTLFAQASTRYAAYEIGSERPAEWMLIVRFFAAVTRWAASGETDTLMRLADELASLPAMNEEIEHLNRVVSVYLRHAEGEQVTAETKSAALTPTSRAFLALILLTAQDENAVCNMQHARKELSQ